jgi:hypothetical protein
MRGYLLNFLKEHVCCTGKDVKRHDRKNLLETQGNNSD